ncbi:hypothetical protein [Streptomyces canus]|uniref:hypothetical protein n=1 Tax=Streptomyces canus TaxID=58343 RepID=UPI003865C386
MLGGRPGPSGRASLFPDREALDVRRRRHQRKDPRPRLRRSDHPDRVRRAQVRHRPPFQPRLRRRGPEAPAAGGNAHGLAFWQTAELDRPEGGTRTVTGVPARHDPVGCEPVTGDVVGFILTTDYLPSVHVSGDNAALEHVKATTLDSAQGADAAKLLGARRVVPAHFESWVHFDSWAHFKEGPGRVHRSRPRRPPRLRPIATNPVQEPKEQVT